MERWYYTDIRSKDGGLNACFGIGFNLDSRKCIFAPPVVGWMNSKTVEEVWAYFKQKKAQGCSVIVIELT